MTISEVEALSVVSVADMRSELRIPDDSHDAILTGQIVSAVNFVHETTGVAVADMLPLRAAIISAARDMYNGVQELSPRASFNSWMDAYRSFEV